MSSLRDLARQGLRFGTVGLWATAVYTVAAAVAHGIGASPSLANALGYAVATTVSFLGHFYWTFGKSTGHARAFLRFLAVSGGGFLLSAAITHTFTAWLGAPFWATLAAIVGVVPPATLLAGRYWAFR